MEQILNRLILPIVFGVVVFVALVAWSDYHSVQASLLGDETSVLLRLASGSTENLHVEKTWTEVLFRLRGPDSLLYYPLNLFHASFNFSDSIPRRPC